MLYLLCVVFGDAQEEACGVFAFPCVNFVCCWSMHSGTIPLLADTLLLFWRVQQVSLFYLFVRVVLLCVVDCSPTSPNSGANLVGGFLRSEEIDFSILLFVVCVVFLLFLFM